MKRQEEEGKEAARSFNAEKRAKRLRLARNKKTSDTNAQATVGTMFGTPFDSARALNQALLLDGVRRAVLGTRHALRPWDGRC